MGKIDPAGGIRSGEGGGWSEGGDLKEREPALQLGRDVGADDDLLILVANIEDVADAVNLRDEGGLAGGDAIGGAEPPCGKLCLELGEHGGEAEACASGDGDGIGGAAELGLDEVAIGEGVDFIKDCEHLLAVGIELADDGVDGVDLLLEIGVAEVNDVDEEVRLVDFLEGGLERLDDGVRELADEADCVGEEDFLVIWEEELAGGGVERGEKLIGGEDAGAGEEIEESGLAGVCVANEGGDGPMLAAAALALDGAVLADIGEIALEAGDALLDAAAVDLELSLAGAAGADAAALAGKVCPHAGEAREEVLKLGELDLKAALAGVSALGEDIEDELGAVEDLAGGEFFQVAPLGGGELVIEDDRGDLLDAALLGDVLGLALADIEGGGGLVEFLGDGADDIGAGGGGQLGELEEGVLEFPFINAIALEAYEEGLLPGPMYDGIEHSGGGDLTRLRRTVDAVIAVSGC